MSYKLFKLVLIFIIVVIDVIESQISIGEYPDYSDKDLNLPDCGYNRMLMEETTISFDKNCFRFEHDNITLKTFRPIGPNIESPSGRVSKGTNAKFGEAPWVVYMVSKISGERVKCTGVLITFEWVLTAADCVLNADRERNVEVRVSAGDIRPEGVEERWVDRTKIFVHPDYGVAEYPEGLMSDIAMVKVRQPFTRYLNDSGLYRINPICLPGADQAIEPGVWENDPSLTIGENATFYGFGRLENDEYTATLKKGEDRVYSCFYDFRLCTKYTNSINQSLMCKGDSGGSLVQFVAEHRAVLIGLIMTHEKDARTCWEHYHSVFTSVPKFIQWILETITNY